MMTRTSRFRHAIVAFSTLMMLFVSGCQSASQENRQIDDIPLDRRVGIIKSLGGIYTSSAGTHLLQLDDGSTILLKSLPINLDDDRYKNVMVEVRGVITYSTDEKPVMEVMNIDVLDQPEFTIDDKPEWTDFANNTLGIKLRYRDDLTMVESDDGVTFDHTVVFESDSQETEATQESPVKHMFSVERAATGTDLLSFLKVSHSSLASLDSSDLVAAGLSESRIGVGDMDVVKEAKGTATNYYLESGSAVYRIVIDPGNDEQTIQDQKLFYDMLASLQISGAASAAEGSTQELSTQEGAASATDASSVATSEDSAAVSAVDIPASDNFGVFESESLGFSMGYPKNWYFAGKNSSEADVIRHYDFGGKADSSAGDATQEIEVSGVVALDLMSGSVPSGKNLNADGKTIVEVTGADGVMLYYQGANGRIYRVSGPQAQETTLLQMLASIEEK